MNMIIKDILQSEKKHKDKVTLLTEKVKRRRKIN